jgi:hypothetical protein
MLKIIKKEILNSLNSKLIQEFEKERFKHLPYFNFLLISGSAVICVIGIIFNYRKQKLNEKENS